MMKNNQYGRLTVDLNTEFQELKDIHFIDNQLLDYPKDQLLDFLKRAFKPQTKTDFHELLHHYLASANLNLLDFFESQSPLTTDIFALLALQLLEFEAGIDFDIQHPLEAFSKINLPSFDIQHFSTSADVAHAWYILLTTHTKNGETYLDVLTQNGYFTDFYASTTKPLFFNGKAQAVFDPHQLIRDVVYVEAPLDTDHDGKLDLIKAEILRPAQTNHGYKAPVLYTASPYNQGTNDDWGEKLTHNVDVELQAQTPNQLSKNDVTYVPTQPELPAARKINSTTKTATQHFAKEAGYTLNNYFLARGFAVVHAAGIGTRDSDGLRDTGSMAETLSATAVIEWLAGQRTAFTNRTDNIAVTADWSNQNIAMTGRSYLGTLATAAATTGVKGLKTIISEAAISSWYDYYRDGGLVVAPDTFQGEDMDVLAGEVFSRKQDLGDYATVQEAFEEQLSIINQAQNRASGAYSKYWDEKNYLNNVKNIKADLILVHGLNDWNVKPRNVFNLWKAVEKLPIQKKLILHQGQHIYINNFRSLDFTDMMNLWLSHKLFGIENNAATQLPNVIIQDNTVPETWNTYEDWQADSSTLQTFNLDQQSLTTAPLVDNNQTASFNDQLPDEDFEFYKNNLNAWQTDLLNDASNNSLKNNRLIFKTKTLDQDWFLDGEPHLDIKVAVNQNFGMLSFQLVDFGEAKRLNISPSTLSSKALSGAFDWRTDDLKEFTLENKKSPWKMISKGHINLQNQHNNYQIDAITPNEFFNVELKLQPTFYHLPAGHQLGLVVYATDFKNTIRGNQDLTYTLKLAECQLKIKLANPPHDHN